jgi:hypothetical protein
MSLFETPRYVAQRAMTSVNSLGTALSHNSTVMILLLIATILMIASVCVPYYTDASGNQDGVYSNCLGYSDTLNCNTMKALPVITILFALFAVLFMSAHMGIPYISQLPGVRYIAPMISGRIITLESIFAGFGITVVPLIVLTTIFAIATLATQLGTPITMSGSTVPLVEQSQKACSSNPITLGNGMALSSASTALFIFVFLILVVKAENITKFMAVQY